MPTKRIFLFGHPLGSSPSKDFIFGGAHAFHINRSDMCPPLLKIMTSTYTLIWWSTPVCTFFLKHPRALGSHVRILDAHVDRTQRRRGCPSSLGTRHTEVLTPHAHAHPPQHLHLAFTQKIWWNCESTFFFIWY